MINLSSLDIYFALWVLVFGLCIGSFLNVVILRGLTNESIVYPSSKCPVCSNKLKWWMNIPVLSYVILRGKCHFCHTHISLQYPLVELLCGVLFVLIFLNFWVSYETLFYIIATSLLVVMSVCDIKEGIIFDVHSYLLILAGFIYTFLTLGKEGILFSLIGALVGFLIYEILARSGYLFAGQRAFGEGDSLIAAGVGAFFGWKLMILSVLLSVLIMSVFSLPYFLVHSYKTGKKRTVRALLVVFVLLIGAFSISKMPFMENLWASLGFTLFVTLSAGICIKEILSDMKQTKEDSKFCILPFGPAIAVSFLIIMFFNSELKDLISLNFG